MATGSSGNGMRSELAVAGGAVVALLVVAAGYIVWQVARDGDDPVPAPVAQVAPETTSETAQATEQPTPEPEIPAPSFDVVRVDPEGNAVVAGFGSPGQAVSILIDGLEVAVAEPDAQGNFVAMFSLDAGEVPRVMSLQSGADEVVASVQSVIVEPGEAPLVSAPADEALAVARAGVEAASEPSASDPALSADSPAEAAQPAPPRVLLADDSGIRVIQDGAAATPEVMETITIDTIAYDDEGGVELTGRGQGAATVQVYLNNAPIRTTRIAEDGSWRAPLPDVQSGVYTLRVDELAEDGTVTSRSETPFKREEPAALAAAAAEGAAASGDAPALRRVTVQPGSTLWAIAQDRYGEGVLYVRVFEANRNSIRDPDLIYPGQVFDLPDE